jgi:hypothetical protein
MDMLWVALGISAVVGFVFYAMASYWGRLLKSHSKVIRFLTQRVEALEEMEDPRLRQRLGDSAPSPLEQVYIFSFRLGERFWPETIGATPEQMRYIREQGKFLGSAKIERWRSHITVTLTELLPQTQSAGWKTRTVDIYPMNGSSGSAVLWELYLEAPANTAERETHPLLELRYEEELLVLRARGGRLPANRERMAAPENGGRVLFRVPLERELLSEYRVSEEESEIENGEDGAAVSRGRQRKDSWVTFYRHEDEKQGVDWQLCLRDLGRKAAWEQWRIVEPQQARRAG